MEERNGLTALSMPSRRLSLIAASFFTSIILLVAVFASFYTAEADSLVSRGREDRQTHL